MSRWDPPRGETSAGTYVWGGLSIDSNFALPRLHGSRAPANVRFRWRSEPRELPPVRERWEWPAADGNLVEMLAGGDPAHLRYEITGVGAFLISVPLGTIDFFAAEGADPMLVEHTLVNSVLPVFTGLQGSICLHASAASNSDGAVVFAGPTGIGKSTLAHRHVEQGWDLVADDAVVLRPEGSGWWLLPGSRTLRLKELSDADGWDIRGKREVLHDVPATPRALREIWLVVREEAEPADVVTAWRSLLVIQSGWRWASSEARAELESSTWKLVNQVPVRTKARGEIGVTA